MDIQNGRALRQLASERLAQARYNPRKLVLLHTGAALVLTTLLTVLNFILTRKIDTTGGLSGIGSRAILETVQTMLQYASTVLLPFWELGIVAAAIGLARGQETGPKTLLEGFRRFFPALRMFLLRLVLYFVVAMVCINISITLFTLTPLARPMLELLEPILSGSNGTLNLDQILAQMPAEEMLRAMMPIWAIFAVLYAIIMLPLHYRLRLAEFVLMDAPKPGAIAALRESSQMMRHNRWKLFRLDLGFWWFYLLQGVVALLCYGDILVDWAGIELPVTADARFFLFYAAYVLCQLALYVFAWGKVQTTYAAYYDALLQYNAPVQQPAPKSFPWNYQ